MMSAKWFEPYIIPHPIVLGRRFVIGNKQARDWYDPLPDALREELIWIRDNVDLGAGRNVLDGGCHHGIHTVTMAGECDLLAMDIHRPNITMLEVNAAINGLNVNFCHAAITHIDGVTIYNGEPMGVLTPEGDEQIKIPCVRIPTIMPDVNVVKLDIEGAEFQVIPDCIDELEDADTWIVEMHPFRKSPEKDGYEVMYEILEMFEARNYTAHWIDRAEDKPYVKPYRWEQVRMYSTFFLQRQ